MAKDKKKDKKAKKAAKAAVGTTFSSLPAGIRGKVIPHDPRDDADLALHNVKEDALEFVRQAAGLTKDGECETCGKDGEEKNRKCKSHEAWIMENDDAVETLHSLISSARGILADARKAGAEAAEG